MSRFTFYLNTVLVGALAPLSLSAGGSDSAVAKAVAIKGLLVTTTDLHPFQNIAYIPMDADPSSIQMRRVKMVKIPSTISISTTSSLCEEIYPEPGGSLFCPLVQLGSKVAAYEVTYSFTAPPLASDEYGSRSHTFRVYFRPEDLKAAVAGRRAAAGDFQVTTARSEAQRVVLDTASSKPCEGFYADGCWMQSDPRCAEKLIYKTVAVPSEYLSVTVNPVSTVLKER